MTDNRRDQPTLRQRLDAGALVLAPGVFDLVSARIADTMGFDALYMTGYGVTASHLGLPDAGIATYTDMVGCAQRIADGTRTPLIADADTGYGGLLNVQHTVQGYERAGVAAIQIEDQEMPKKCGHTTGRTVIALEDMVLKIKVAVAARRSADTLIIARTDARTALGLDEAIRRGQAFAAAGADVVFVESPESEAEMAAVARAIEAPLLANMVVGGRTPIVSQDRLSELGYRIAIYPVIGLSAAAEALNQVYRHLLDHGDVRNAPVPAYPTEALHTLMGFQEVWDFEARWNRDGGTIEVDP